MIYSWKWKREMEMAGSRLEESDGVAVVPFLVPQLPGKKLPQEETQVTSVSTFLLEN